MKKIKLSSLYGELAYDYINSPDKDYLAKLKGKTMTLEEISKLNKCFKDIGSIMVQVIDDNDPAIIDLDNLDGYIPGINVKILDDIDNISSQTRVKILDWYIDS